jgi:hypothetical protein
MTDHPGLPDGVRTMSSMTEEEAQKANANIEAATEWANLYLNLMHEHMEEAHADEHPFCSPLCMSMEMIQMLERLERDSSAMILSVLLDYIFKSMHNEVMGGVPDEHGCHGGAD